MSRMIVALPATCAIGALAWLGYAENLSPVIPAYGAESAKTIDFTVDLADNDGKPIVDPFKCPNNACDTPLTLGDAAYYGLTMPERGITFDDGIRRNDLAVHVRQNKEWPLQPGERELIKKTLPNALPWPAVLGAVNRELSK